MGVQLPGPDSTSFEEGFDATSVDMSSLASPAPLHVGVEMPGVSMGVDVADIMQDMASQDPTPQGPGIGVESGDGINDNDQSSSAGYHRVDSFDAMFGTVPGRNAPDSSSAPGQAMQGLMGASLPNQGYPNAGDGYGGIDSMLGLDFAGGPAPIAGNQQAGVSDND